MRHERIRPLVVTVLATWLVAGCALMTASSTTTEITLSGRHEGRIVECRSATPITGDDCQIWGEEILDGMPAEAAQAGRLVLTDGPGVGRCSADFQDARGAIYASASVVCP